MKISELSEKTGASVRSIRHYEAKGLVESRRLENGYRDFDESAVERIQTIQLYLGLGLNTDQIADIVSCQGHSNQKPEGLCEELLTTYEEKLEEINRQIDTLTTVKQRLEKQIRRFKEKKSQHEREGTRV